MMELRRKTERFGKANVGEDAGHCRVRVSNRQLAHSARVPNMTYTFIKSIKLLRTFVDSRKDGCI